MCVDICLRRPLRLYLSVCVRPYLWVLLQHRTLLLLQTWFIKGHSWHQSNTEWFIMYWNKTSYTSTTCGIENVQCQSAVIDSRTLTTRFQDCIMRASPTIDYETVSTVFFNSPWVFVCGDWTKCLSLVVYRGLGYGADSRQHIPSTLHFLSWRDGDTATVSDVKQGYISSFGLDYIFFAWLRPDTDQLFATLQSAHLLSHSDGS